MPTKDPVKNREYVAKSRQKLINSIGIEEYRRRNAESQRKYRKKQRALKNANMYAIRDRYFDVNDLIK